MKNKQTVWCDFGDKFPNTIARFLSFAVLLVLSMVTDIVAENSTRPFVIRASSLTQGFEESGTNIVFNWKIEGTLLFSFKDGTWQSQFTYQSNYCSKTGYPPPGYPIGTKIDCRCIPGGMREIISYGTNLPRSNSKISTIHPWAEATTNTFPEWGRQELFLPWLSLCPSPRLPLVDSSRMRIDFNYNFLGSPQNAGKFEVNYLNPDDSFISDLVVTNYGVIFLSNGGVFKLPAPFTDGFPQFSYRVIDTTNFGKMTFPFDAVLTQFVLKQNAKSASDTFALTVSHMHVDQIDLGEGSLIMEKVPESLVALDRRPAGLGGLVTVNYEVTNDTWFPVENPKIARLAKLTRVALSHANGGNNQATRNRSAVIFIFLILTLVPIIILVKIKHTNQPNKI